MLLVGGKGRAALGFQRQRNTGVCAMARGIRDPSMDAVVVILFDPYRVQSCGYRRRRGAGHLAARSAQKALDLSLVLRVMSWSIIHGPLDRRTDATKFTASKLAAVVAYELPWDATALAKTSFTLVGNENDRVWEISA